MTTLFRHDRQAALAQFQAVRSHTLDLVAGLSPEDMTVQSMPDASPLKWHVGHTTWFFETFLLDAVSTAHSFAPAAYGVLFNSYYQTIGPQWARAARGHLSRPNVAEVLAWRQAVDASVAGLILSAGDAAWAKLAPILEIGLNHEQQHQELICTDLRHALSLNPLEPAAYPLPQGPWPTAAAQPLRFDRHDGGVVSIGAEGKGFAFDNEGPRHRTFLQPHALANRLVTNGEFLGFITDGGYQAPALWLAEGWERLQAEGLVHPLYWRCRDGAWFEHTLYGTLALDPHAPVNGLSAFEAAAYAVWAGARLPTEGEWERGARQSAAPVVAAPLLHPVGAAQAEDDPSALFGQVWQWTQSAYAPYPGFTAPAGALGEYNGKFMINQLVLRGSSCATPAGHSRATYRNFFPAHARWQFAGLRLAKDV
jgi:ergothioneine biosynthesis protein EgtB